jgi:Kef-type K+ transport system membrane component KefB
MVIYLTVFSFLGYWLLPKLVKMVTRLSISQGVSTLAILTILLFGITAELIGGMAAITGSFLAGLMFSRISQKQEVEHSIHAIAYGFFVPIFFVSIGLSVDLSGFQMNTLGFIVILSLVAIIGKVFGSGVGAKIANYTWSESLQVGIGMVSRGEVGLIVAKIGVDAGLISNTVFSAIIAMVIITTIVTPVLLRASFRMNG